MNLSVVTQRLNFSTGIQFRFVQEEHAGGYCNCWGISDLKLTTVHNGTTHSINARYVHSRVPFMRVHVWKHMNFKFHYRDETRYKLRLKKTNSGTENWGFWYYQVEVNVWKRKFPPSLRLHFQPDKKPHIWICHKSSSKAKIRGWPQNLIGYAGFQENRYTPI